ncbi:SixA phosphatase family protein [Rhodococcus sp. NPDC058521]|uniref:SixA phosphatase family protein n=1 Tax=Rhodococcus sp. NPDC058521 TaxID=3346536 RepID=UPI00365041DD
MTANRTLVLMRHGKSGYPEGVADHDRPLAERGENEAALAGEWLRANQPPIETVLCSTSVRTRQTLAATGIDAPTQFLERLYGAYPAEILTDISEVDESVQTLLVIGHAPGMPSTALDLVGNPDSDDARAIREKFPTSALAVLSVEGDWADLTSGAASLVTFHVPRQPSDQ